MIEAFLAKIGEIFAEKAIDKASGTRFTPKMKRILLITVCACVLLSGIAFFFYFGYRFTWSLDDKGVLTIEKGFLRHEMPTYRFEKPNFLWEYSEDMYPIFVNKAPWFSQREEITHIILPDGITNISSAAFAGCVNLQEVYIPDSLTTISDYAFNDCSSLEHIAIPLSITHIGDCAFNQCHALQYIRLGNLRVNITMDIGEYAFRNCDNLSHAFIYNVTEIGYGAFWNCSSLTYIDIPNSVTYIEIGAFGSCDNLKSVSIPAGAEIGENAFPEWTEVTVRQS